MPTISVGLDSFYLVFGHRLRSDLSKNHVCIGLRERWGDGEGGSPCKWATSFIRNSFRREVYGPV